MLIWIKPCTVYSTFLSHIGYIYPHISNEATLYLLKTATGILTGRFDYFKVAKYSKQNIDAHPCSVFK